jgi:hypothetical protein
MSIGPMLPRRPDPSPEMAALRSQAALATALCKTALETWRLLRLGPRLCETDQARVQAIADRLSAGLTQAGVIIEDHTDQAFVEGLSVEILTTEIRMDLAPGEHRIVETVKPSVYIAGQLASAGQIILGRGATTEERRTNGPRND